MMINYKEKREEREGRARCSDDAGVTRSNMPCREYKDAKIDTDRSRQIDR